MRFLVDAQLPPGLARWIAGQGQEAAHVVDLGLSDASDHQIWDHAISSDLIVVTKDHDFVEWATARRPAARVIWIRLGNMNNAALVGRLASVWDKVIERLESGSMVVEAGKR